MPRNLYLDLAARGHAVPIAVDLILHQHADHEAIVHDGARLGTVVAEAAAALGTPLAFPLMDLRLEKRELLRFFAVPDDEIERYHFPAAPAAEARRDFLRWLHHGAPGPRVTANLGAIHHIRTRTALEPIGMCIGPFSLTTKLMADPITPVYLAGSGVTPEEEPDVALLVACLQMAEACVFTQVERALAAGARAVFIAEPAANQIYFSPLQLAEGSDIFERCVLRPNRRIAALLADRGADLLFHCCGELCDAMLAGFASLRPALLSLGGSRRLWADAAHVPRDTVLYGNVPSKSFYSDQLMPVARVAEIAADLRARMAATGHPFILGTECDTLFVPEYAAAIRAKVDCLRHAR